MSPHIFLLTTYNANGPGRILLLQQDTCLFSVFKHIIPLLLSTQSVGNLFHPFMVIDNFVQWKNADITPIYKKGDASQVSNYRPISILPAMCRLFERILADDINFHLYHNRLITDAQYGFVKGRSTELQLLNCSKMWINAIDSNKFVDTVYIDFSKAFDTVSHRKLLH